MLTEEITLEGHIVDSLILSRVLDEILAGEGDYHIREFRIGQHRNNPSFARIEISASDANLLSDLIAKVGKHGAVVKTPQDARMSPTDRDGVFPEGFYSTTNQPTMVRLSEEWHEIHKQEMDCGIRFDPTDNTFTCIPVTKAKAGDAIVVGHQGVKVIPAHRPEEKEAFGFMSSAVSSEKPKNVMIHDVAEKMKSVRASGKKLLLVGGPAIVHTGSGQHIVRLIEAGYIHVLFAGNALATHDIEQAIYGTSLGVCMNRATHEEAGHEHHIRAINTIRRAGSIRAAVDNGTLTSGIMHACVTHDVDFVLAGSVRDDGPLPDVITDMLDAQDAMRERIPAIGFTLVIATALHGIATGNLLPASVPVVCVDIQPSVVTKLADRGTTQTVGIVTDVEPFLRELLTNLDL
jgi:lysine-ketoglutarate reductase/saccharopine dehydrogenase-like protein (TIGR00300 family)